MTLVCDPESVPESSIVVGLYDHYSSDNSFSKYLPSSTSLLLFFNHLTSPLVIRFGYSSSFSSSSSLIKRSSAIFFVSCKRASVYRFKPADFFETAV